MLKSSSLASWGAAVLLLSSLSSCEDILEPYFPKPTPPPPPTIPAPLVAYTSYAVQSGNTVQNGLLLFNPATRTTLQQLPITGLSAPIDCGSL